MFLSYRSVFVFVAFLPALATAVPSVLVPLAPEPTVHLDHAIFTGITDGTTNRFLGIPFAQPPVGSLRLRLPVRNAPYTGTHDASAFGNGCAQQTRPLKLPPGLPPQTLAVMENFTTTATTESEDCLFINVVQPAGIDPSRTRLPIAVWIYGGGFQDGDTSTFDGSVIVKRSIELGEPVIYVSMNYRLNAFGFLPGRQVQEAGLGNLGLHDQREALRWVQKYITAFGGDSTKVTIFGESAGAISVSLQMLTNNGNAEGLFRGAFMQSGSPQSIGDITTGQGIFDAIVQDTGCGGESDPLECLRGVPFQTLLDAVNLTPSLSSFRALELTWQPRVDGVFLTDNFQQLVQKGSVADIPFVNGDCDDEGTFTDQGFRDFVTQVYFPDISAAELDRVLALYPSDAAQGSPFGTGGANALTPQFKRIAAFQGDLIFQAPRRFFFSQRASKMPTWSFLSQRNKTLPFLGSYHSSDNMNMYGPSDMTDLFLNFVNHLDPNGPNPEPETVWPKYDASDPMLLTFADDGGRDLTRDGYRGEAIAFLGTLAREHPF